MDITTGKTLVPTFLDRLADVMNDDSVKSFFSDYFSTWEDTKTAIMFMQLYALIDDTLYQINGQRPDRDKVVSTVKSMITSSEARATLVNAMEEFAKSGNKTFITILATKQIESQSKRVLLPA